MTDTVYQSPGYKRSRRAYCMQAAFEYFIAILVSDAYLAKLLTHIGLDDSLIGIIASLISAAFLFQLTAVFFVQRIRNVKRTVILFNILGCLLFTGLYLIPFLPGSAAFKSVLVIVCLLAAYFGNYFVASMLFKWANSFVDPRKRGEYSATKEMISLLSGMVFTLAVGMLIDHFEALDRLTTGFLFIAAAGLILSVCCFICFLMIGGDIRQAEQKTDHTDPAAPRHSLRDVLANTFGNRSFVNVVILMSLWNIAQYLTVGFLGTFKTTDLLLSVGTVQLINIGSNLVRFCISKPFGRYSDKTSYARGMQLAMMISALGFLANVFTTKGTWWCIILYSVLHAASFAGTNQNSYNILYSYVDADYFVEAMAIKNSIAGVLGFSASLVGAKILAAIQARGNMLFGIPLYGQQLLSLLSCVLVLVCIVFLRCVIDKQKIMKQ